MKKVCFFILLLVAAIATIAPFYQSEYKTLGQTRLNRFSSYEELENFLKANSEGGPCYFASSGGQTLGISTRDMGSNAETATVPDYSTTNVQVEGVDEADVIKTDGEYIYVVSENSVVILRAHPPEGAQVLSQTKLNGTLRGIFINGDRLVIFEDDFGYYGSYERFIARETPRTFIKVYDVSNKESPVLGRNFSLDGYYFNSRMVGDFVYAVINQPANLNEDGVDLPSICSGDGVEEISAIDIYYSKVSDRFDTFTTIVAINVQNDEEEPAYETILLGSASTIYVSLNNIYVTFLEWGVNWNEGITSIHRIHVENGEVEYVASGEVPGYVLNQFSMDEHEGYFRIATTSWEGTTSRNNVYVLDMDLDIVGRLEDLAPRETIYSARFMGERCYVVTFKKVDPLFVIDLENPYAPEVLGYLKITGYSDYLHPYDENHIIGIGKETEAAEEGDFAWYQGVKISLFDVTEVAKPKEIAKYEIGDRGTDSPVLSDHKAFLFDKSKNLLVIPVLVAEIDPEKYPNGVPPNAYGDYVWQSAYVFNISLDGLVLRGGITHLKNGTELMKSGYYFSSPYSVKRALYIDNVLYTISDKKIKMNSLENLGGINEVELP